MKPTQFIVAIATILLAASPLVADLTVNFVDGDPPSSPFNGNEAGDSVVSTGFIPPSTFNDGTIGTITTHTVTNSGNLTTSSTGIIGLGIDSGAGNANEFDGGEEWRFSWDVGTQFLAIKLNKMQANDVLTIQSDDWTGLSIANDTNPLFDTTYNSLTGSLSIKANPTNPFLPALSGEFNFSANDLFTSAGTQIGISYTSVVGTGASIQSMTFTNPEPSTIILTSVGLAAFGAGSWWKKRKAKGDQSASTDTETGDANDAEAITS